jgi:hypothetical protein
MAEENRNRVHACLGVRMSESSIVQVLIHEGIELASVEHVGAGHYRARLVAALGDDSMHVVSHSTHAAGGAPVLGFAQRTPGGDLASFDLFAFGVGSMPQELNDDHWFTWYSGPLTPAPIVIPPAALIPPP